jgi:hypothetical protein
MTSHEHTNVKEISNLPSFHDAELITITNNPSDYAFTLHFQRINGSVETISFTGVMAQRVMDFAEQNIVSRLLISAHYHFSSAEIRAWLQWVNSRDDATASAIDDKTANEYAQNFANGSGALFVLEPSCGAEIVVHCKDIWLRHEPIRKLGGII